MSQTILINNPQSRVQGISIPQNQGLKLIVFKPGFNEVLQADWDNALQNELFEKKVSMGYLEVVTGIETKKTESGAEKIKITESLIKQTLDIELLEKWLKDSDTPTKQRNVIKTRIKTIKEQTEKKEEKKESLNDDLDSLTKDFE